MVPKANFAAEFHLLAEVLRGAPLWAVLETAKGIGSAAEIAAAIAPTAGGVLFGGADYSAEIGADLSDWDAMAFARGALAAACGGAGIALLDVPYLDVRDTDGLSASTRRVKALGYTGRACIHPDQVAAVNAVFTPTAAEIDRARRVIAALEDAKGAAALLDGKLVELPVIRAARRVLDRAKEQ
jgi:citrate lyase subunit beta/citryl-CoA lyase/(S)-citramalyl-CoA lyase